MKEFLSTIVLLLVGVVPASAASTLEHSLSGVHVDIAQRSISCEGWSSLLTEQGVSLPARTYLIELQTSESASDVRYSCSDSTISANFGSPSPADLLTALDSRYDIPSLLRSSLTGADAVVVLDEISLDSKRFVRVLACPATVDRSGAVHLHSSLTLSVASRTLAASELIPVDEIGNVAQDRAAYDDASDNSPGYVIVTSRALAPALEPFRRYKNETGYAAQVALIEDIVASHTGRDDAERLRNYLNEFYVSGGRYVLLAGDETVLPIRYAYHYTNHTDTAISLSEQQICDLYFADMTGDWNRDNDNTWGERLDDAADINAELLVGRLPFNSPEEFAAYTANLIRYETAPGGTDRSYLSRAFFYSSDQMRDLNDGQHNRIAEVYPPVFAIDTVSGVEATRGDDPAPSNLSPAGLQGVLESGYGIINVLAHGRVDGFVLKSSNYNEWPKTLMLSADAGPSHGSFVNMTASNKPAFYYSLACDNASFDADQPPFNDQSKNLCQTLLSLPDGAVGFVGYTRWGWVGSSYILQRAFFDSLFAHPEQPASAALDAIKQAHYYYRDMVYGLNYFGDPSLRVYSGVPQTLSLESKDIDGEIQLTVTNQGQPVAACAVIVSLNGEATVRTETNVSGQATLDLPSDGNQIYTFSLVKSGFVTARGYLSGSIATDVQDEGGQIPDRFALSQNYPNPFNPSTAIAFELPKRSDISLRIYNILGEEVRTLIESGYGAGHHAVEWDGRDNAGQHVASGLYFYRLTAEDFVQTKKMLLLE